MNKELIIEMANKSFDESSFTDAEVLCFAILVAKQQREEDAKLVENMTLEWSDQPEFAQVEGSTIADCALIIRQRDVTYD